MKKIRCIDDEICKQYVEFLKKIGLGVELEDGDNILTPGNSTPEEYIFVADQILEEIKKEKGYPNDWDVLEMYIDETDGGVLDYAWIKM